MPERRAARVTAERPAWVVRVTVCLLLALVGGHFTYTVGVGHHQDFAQVWYAARVVLRGANPYHEIGRLKPFHWPWPFYYPLPAALVALPLAPLSERMAMTVVGGLGVGAFAWALTAHGYWPLVALLSACMGHALTITQWAPLLTGAVAIAPLGVLLVAKPTIGAAIFAARPTWWAVLGGAALTVAAFVVQPHWVADWIRALHGPVQPGKDFHALPPILLPGGVLTLAALTRWRRPEARLLAAMACVPQTLLPYEAVPLFLIPRGPWQCVGFTLASYAMTYLVRHTGPYEDFAATTTVVGKAMVAMLYLPATLMVLRRPNEGRNATA